MRIRIRMLLFLMGVLISLGGGLAWHAGIPAVYEARAALQLADERGLQTLNDPGLKSRARERLLRKWGGEAGSKGNSQSPGLRGELTFDFEFRERSLNLSYLTTAKRHAVEELNALIEQFLEEQKADVAARRLAEREHERTSLRQEADQIAADLSECERTEVELSREKMENHSLEIEQSSATEQIKTLSKALAFARLSRTELEQHIRIVEEYLNDQKSIGMMVAKLPEGRVREYLKGILDQQQIQTELDQTREMKQELSGIYGKNHPRLKELDHKITLLSARESSGVLPAAYAEKGDLTQAGMLLQTIRSFVQQARTYEDDLQLRLEREQATVDAEQRTDRELEALAARMEQGRSRVAEIERRLGALGVQPSEPQILVRQVPWLLPNPVSVSRETVLVIALCPGVLLGLLLNGISFNRGWKAEKKSASRKPNLPSLQERRRMRQNSLQQTQGGEKSAHRLISLTETARRRRAG